MWIFWDQHSQMKKNYLPLELAWSVWVTIELWVSTEIHVECSLVQHQGLFICLSCTSPKYCVRPEQINVVLCH